MKDKDRKTFKETGLGQFLTQKLPGAVDHIVDLVPDRGVLGFVKNVIDGSILSPEEKLEAHQMLLEEYELEVQDRDSARNREIELAKAGAKDWMMFILGIVLLALLSLTVIAVLFHDIKNENLAYLLIGQLLGMVGMMVAYYYGTSQGSASKNRIIEQLKKAMP